MCRATSHAARVQQNVVLGIAWVVAVAPLVWATPGFSIERAWLGGVASDTLRVEAVTQGGLEEKVQQALQETGQPVSWAGQPASGTRQPASGGAPAARGSGFEELTLGASAAWVWQGRRLGQVREITQGGELVGRVVVPDPAQVEVVLEVNQQITHFPRWQDPP